MKISTAIVTNGAVKDVQVSLILDGDAAMFTFRLDAKSAKAVALALTNSAAEAESVLVMPGFDSTPVRGA